jgi:hypothetical protein
MKSKDDGRTQILRYAGASDSEVAELLGYAENRFSIPPVLPDFPLPDEPFVDVWRSYAEVTALAGSINPLRHKLVQLAFPVEAGMSENAAYQAATRRGIMPSADVRSGVFLQHPDTCRVTLYDSFAGAIGVITAECRADFETFVQAFTAKNEPIPVRTSMGATIIAGYNNWHRIWLLKEEFLRSGGTDREWSTEFSRIKAQRELYQDRFILLSNGPYSGVNARSLGLDDEEWIERSRTIRLEHEYAHYFTRRVFGSMQNNLLDEIMADYAGLRSAFGCFRAAWILQFLGLESYPEYREGGRLQNYRGVPTLSDGAFRILIFLVRQAALNLEEFDSNVGSNCSIPKVLMALASMTIDELAAASAPRLLAEKCSVSVCSGTEYWMAAAHSAI